MKTDWCECLYIHIIYTLYTHSYTHTHAHSLSLSISIRTYIGIYLHIVSLIFQSHCLTAVNCAFVACHSVMTCVSLRTYFWWSKKKDTPSNNRISDFVMVFLPLRIASRTFCCYQIFMYETVKQWNTLKYWVFTGQGCWFHFICQW